MRTFVIAAGALLALGGCGDNQAADTPAPATQPAALDPVQQQVIAMADGPRNAVLIRAIRDAGRECQNVETSTRQADARDGSPTWLAQCAGGPAYVVGVGRQGNVSVTPAGAAGQAQ